LWEDTVLTLNNRWSVLALFFFARASMAVQFQSIPPISTLLVDDLSFNYTQIGVLLGLFMFPGIFIAIPGGLLGQRFGDRAVVLAGFSLQTVGALVFANASTFSLAFAGRLIGGIGLVLLNVQVTKIINDWFANREISTSMGILMTSWPFGIALALSTLGSLAVTWSWQTAIYLTAAYSAISMALIALLYRDPPMASPISTGTRPSLWAISHRELVLIIFASLVWALGNAGFIVVISFMPSFLVSGGTEVAKAGFLVSLISWITIGSIPLGGWLTDRTGQLNTFIIASILLNTSLVVVILMGAPVLACVLLLGLTVGGWPGAIMSLPGQVLSPKGRSTGFGVFYTVFYLVMAALIPMGGWLRDHTGEAQASVLFGGVVIGLTVVALAMFRMLQRRLPTGEPVQVLEPAS
jgi:MFS family permease